MLIDRGDGENCILPNICMAVFKALAGRLEQRFNKLGFSQLAKETKSIAADVFVRMLQVQADTIAKHKLAFYLSVA